MKIKKLQLKNYRNYDNLELTFNDNLNIIIGDNAQGKTNIIESIYVLAITKSFLSINEKGLIKDEKEFFKIKATISKNQSDYIFEIINTLKTKKVKINNYEIKKIGDYISNFNIILFNPDNIRMLKEGPTVRRKYLNIQICQLNNKYLNILNEYNVLLHQKNEYLKIINPNIKTNLDYLDILNNKIIDLAVEIYKYRKKYLYQVNKYITKIFNKIASNDILNVKYITQISIDDDDKIKENLEKKIQLYQEKELKYKISLIGPHRDDFNFILNDKNISLYGSQGQLRLSVLALKLSEINIFEEEKKEKPVLLLDDIFSELDIKKRNKLISYLDNDIQTILTTTDLKAINKKLLEKAKIFNIKEGKLFPGK